MSYRTVIKWMWCPDCDEEWEVEFLDTGEGHEEKLELMYKDEGYCPYCDVKGERLIEDEHRKEYDPFWGDEGEDD